MLNYVLYYKQYGIRRLQNLLMPRLNLLTGLPRDSMVHHLSEDKEHPDIDISKMYYENSNKIVVDYVEELTEQKGAPRHKNVMVRNLTREFHRKNKKFRYVKDHYQVIQDQLTTFIYNYSYLDQTYNYIDMPMSSYNSWWNKHKTIFDTIDKVNKVQKKNHFVFMELPKVIPPVSLLRLYEGKVNPNMLKIFNTSSSLMVLEIWKWLSEEERETIFSGLTHEDFLSVNIVLTGVDGRSCVLNMGYLYGWVRGHEMLVGVDSKVQLESVQIQKLFIKLLMTLQSTEVAVNEISEAEKEEGSQPETTELDQDAEDDRDEDTEDHTVDALSKKTQKPSTSKEKELQVRDLNEDISSVNLTEEQSLDLDTSLKDLDDELDALEVINNTKLKEKGIKVNKDGEVEEQEVSQSVDIEEIKKKIYQPESNIEALMRQIGDQADYGLLSASDYKKALQDAQKYQESLDPYGGKETVVQAASVTPEMLKLDDEKTKIVVPSLVVDQSMHKSTLNSLDSDYIKKVLKKDILAMVGGIQKAGVIIKNHEIEHEHSILGSYESHTLEIKPVDGVTSTIHFKIPKISEDGTYMVNGTKQVLRKQRVDLPLRKINPTTVALSSYYGKTFVERNPKKAGNSQEWIIKTLAGIDVTTHPYMRQVNPADVFDNNFKAPYIYNAMAHTYKSLVTSKYTLSFDHTDRKNIASEEQLKALEKNGSRVVGYTNNKQQLITVDTSDNFHLFNPQTGEKSDLGDIFQILQLPVQSCPVDYVETKIFSKSVPIATVLGYNIGFHNLIRLLNAKYRKVEARKQLNLENHEYAIRFKDVSYVFSRKDKVASLILAGFTAYEKDLKRYESSDLDHKDIYLNFLESKGMSSIYIREMDMLQSMFVDPITRGILESRGEPTTYNGLLMRSTEMLLGYDHPDTQDMAVMRIRGYERIAGAIYKELGMAIRQYRNKNISGRSRIDISPYQIWSTITKDNAAKLIEDINPIQNLKESEIVTYVGEGGRGKDTLVAKSRAYHINDMGIISEATVDSGDVGVNAYMPPNPKLQDLRGMPQIDGVAPDPSSLMSTAALLAPSSSNDD
jgi:hypothetical protein